MDQFATDVVTFVPPVDVPLTVSPPVSSPTTLARRGSLSPTR